MSKRTAKTDVIVFGIGQFFHTLRDYLLDHFNIIAFADNDTQKQGTLLKNIAVVNPQDIQAYRYDKIIVTVILFQEQIVRQLLDLGVNKDKIILGVNFLMKNDEGNVYEYYIDDQLDIAFKCSLDKCSIIPIEKNNFKYLISSNDTVIASSLINSGDFSQKELDSFFSLADKYYGEQRGVFLDVGANIGTTCLAATKNERVSEVIAIEPSSDNFALLQCNIHLNKLQHKIRAINAAASDANDMVHLLISPDSSGDHRVRDTTLHPAGAKIETIISITIDDLVKDRANEIAFIWIDVQGYEYYALQGAKNLISSSKKLAIQIEFWPFGLEETKTLSLLCQFCEEYFSKYIDISEYLNNSRNVIHNINEIDSLSAMYKKSYTDIFLIP